ncbi:hypothetical protein [Streptomyces sp. NPDC003720]
MTQDTRTRCPAPLISTMFGIAALRSSRRPEHTGTGQRLVTAG